MSAVRRLPLYLAVTCTVSLAGLLFTPAAHAQEQDAAFKDGLDARAAKKWKEAADKMRLAIQADPKESTRKVGRVLGGFLGGGTDYLPHFFLGEALFYLDDCGGAIEAWSQSEQQGAMKSRSESVALVQKGYATCEARGFLLPARYGPVLARVRQQVTEVTSLATSVYTQGQAHIDSWRTEMRDQYDRANRELQSTQKALDDATRSRKESDFNNVSASAERLRGVFKGLDSQLVAAIAQQRQAQTLLKDIEQALAAADASERDIAGKRVSLNSELAASRQAALEAVARVRTQITSLRNPSPSVLTEARTAALDASVKLREVLDAVSKQVAGLQAARLADALKRAQDAFSLVDGAFTSLNQLATERPEKTTPELILKRDALEKEAAAARRRFDLAAKAKDVKRLQDAEGLAGTIHIGVNDLIGQFRPVTLPERGVRDALVEGARQFFAGEHARALVTLDLATVGGGLYQEHVHLFRAAAHYALYVRSGEKDQSHQANAVTEIEKVKQINPDFKPDTRAFAPRFIAFFHASHPSTSQAASPQER